MVTNLLLLILIFNYLKNEGNVNSECIGER